MVWGRLMCVKGLGGEFSALAFAIRHEDSATEVTNESARESKYSSASGVRTKEGSISFIIDESFSPSNGVRQNTGLFKWLTVWEAPPLWMTVLSVLYSAARFPSDLDSGATFCLSSSTFFWWSTSC